jgi:ribonuclease-3
LRYIEFTQGDEGMSKVSHKMDLTPLENKIQYIFQNKALLVTAFTHSSYANEHERKIEDNERLEFLGDSVLNLVITSYLYNKYPSRLEGELTKIRASVVSEASLHKVAEILELGRYLRLGKGEEATGGRRRSSILADAVEALIGAVYLDSGLESASALVLDLLNSIIKQVMDGKLFRDYKTDLQEILQRDSMDAIEYRIIDEVGPSHDKDFIVQVLHRNRVIGSGSGKNKKEAEQQAARNALNTIDL